LGRGGSFGKGNKVVIKGDRYENVLCFYKNSNRMFGCQ
jgi:hypothetical protein